MIGDELAGALALDREIYLRGASESHQLDGGWVARDAALPSIYTLNCIRLAAPLSAAVDAAAIDRLADAWLGDRDHRRVVVEDAAAGERLAPALTAAGWERDRTLFMVLRTDPGHAPRDPRAREISDPELREVNLLVNREEEYGPHAFPGLPELLVQAQGAVRARTPARMFGAGEDGGLQSMTTLFMEEDLDGHRAAMVESVATLRAWRQRGLARAAVSAALRAAAGWGAELITVPCDADDWPQLMYASLGFAPVGRIVTFTRRV